MYTVLPQSVSPTPQADELEKQLDAKRDLYSKMTGAVHSDPAQMSSKDLKTLITSAGLAFDDCVEKSDFVARAKEAQKAAVAAQNAADDATRIMNKHINEMTDQQKTEIALLLSRQ